MNNRTWAGICALAVCFGTPVRAQSLPTYPGCDNLAAADFQVTQLVNRRGDGGAVADASLSEPTRMDVQVVKTAAGAYSHSNIFYVQRLGAVKMYDGQTKQVKTMGTISTPGWDDNGLMGIALDPNYATTRNIFFWYCPNRNRNGGTLNRSTDNRLLRLSRITVKADNTLDMASEKVLIEILGSKTDQWHSGGPMQFDKHGDLWVAIGNNSRDLDPGSCNVMSPTDSTNSSEWGSSNTANMRGGFIRIHPDNSAKGYSIPSGNFGEYWADQFERQGKPASLVAEYRNPAKVLPEIYVKGERSNYSISVHPTKRWLAWGTVNYAGTNDEFNITKTPIFSGFPYFHKNNQKTCQSITFTAAAPMNTSPLNSGVRELPPAIGATHYDRVNVAIGGPLYVFDRSLDSDDKFPPHFDNTWIMAGFGNGGSTDAMWLARLDTSNLSVVGTPARLDPSLFPTPRNFVQGMYGEDGALYLLYYDGATYGTPRNPGVTRISYKGTCKIPVSVSAKPSLAPGYQSIWLSGMALVVAEQGRHEVSWHGMDGRLLHRESGLGRKEYRLQEIQRKLGLHPGVYTVRVKTDKGEFSRSLSML